MVRQLHAGVSRRRGNFLGDDSGSVTTDWVVLVASLVTLSVIVMVAIGGSVEMLADNTEVALNAREVSTY